MKCDKCHRERANGQEYSFQYGNKGGTTYQDSMWTNTRTYRTSIRIHGTETAWICNRCVNLRYVFALAFVLPAALFLVFAGVYVAVDGFGWDTCCFGGFGVLAGIGLLFFARWMRREFGEELAISAKKKALRAQGYSAFFTGFRYSMLDRSGR